MDRYAQMFAGLDEKNQGAFVPFVMVGDPLKPELFGLKGLSLFIAVCYLAFS